MWLRGLEGGLCRLLIPGVDSDADFLFKRSHGRSLTGFALASVLSLARAFGGLLGIGHLGLLCAGFTQRGRGTILILFSFVNTPLEMTRTRAC
jgi:hypothetical protein